VAGVIEFLSMAAERTFGYERSDAVGKELAELIIPPALRQRHREGLRRLAEGGSSEILGKRLELTGMRADGTQFPVELTVTGVELPGRQAMFTGFVRDITDRKRAEEASRRLGDIVESSDDSIISTSLDGTILSWNPGGRAPVWVQGRGDRRAKRLAPDAARPARRASRNLAPAGPR